MEIKVNVTVRKENGWFIAECEEYCLSAKSICIDDSLDQLQKKLKEYFNDEQPGVEASFILVVSTPV